MNIRTWKKKKAVCCVWAEFLNISGSVECMSGSIQDKYIIII